jgi:hypothetical protein
LKQALLAFPDVGSMAEFVLINKLSHVIINSNECFISGLFTDDLIKLAETEYQAQVLYMRVIQ